MFPPTKNKIISYHDLKKMMGNSSIPKPIEVTPIMKRHIFDESVEHSEQSCTRNINANTVLANTHPAAPGGDVFTQPDISLVNNEFIIIAYNFYRDVMTLATETPVDYKKFIDIFTKFTAEMLNRKIKMTDVFNLFPESFKTMVISLVHGSTSLNKTKILDSYQCIVVPISTSDTIKTDLVEKFMDIDENIITIAKPQYFDSVLKIGGHEILAVTIYKITASDNNNQYDITIDFYKYVPEQDQFRMSSITSSFYYKNVRDIIMYRLTTWFNINQSNCNINTDSVSHTHVVTPSSIMATKCHESIVDSLVDKSIFERYVNDEIQIKFYDANDHDKTLIDKYYTNKMRNEKCHFQLRSIDACKYKFIDIITKEEGLHIPMISTKFKLENDQNIIHINYEFVRFSYKNFNMDDVIGNSSGRNVQLRFVEKKNYDDFVKFIKRFYLIEDDQETEVEANTSEEHQLENMKLNDNNVSPVVDISKYISNVLTYSPNDLDFLRTTLKNHDTFKYALKDKSNINYGFKISDDIGSLYFINMPTLNHIYCDTNVDSRSIIYLTYDSIGAETKIHPVSITLYYNNENVAKEITKKIESYYHDSMLGLARYIDFIDLSFDTVSEHELQELSAMCLYFSQYGCLNYVNTKFLHKLPVHENFKSVIIESNVNENDDDDGNNIYGTCMAIASITALDTYAKFDSDDTTVYFYIHIIGAEYDDISNKFSAKNRTIKFSSSTLVDCIIDKLSPYLNNMNINHNGPVHNF